MNNNADDPLTATRLDVAEMKGMLTQALSDQNTRLTNLEKDNVSLHARLSDKAKEHATYAEKIRGLEKAVNVLENDSRAKHARIVGTIGTVIAAIALGTTIVAQFVI